MSNKIALFPIAIGVGRLSVLLLLIAWIHCGNASACNYQDIVFNNCSLGVAPDAIYDNPGGAGISDQIALCPSSSTVSWTLAPGAGCTGTPSTITCGTTMTIVAPPSAGGVLKFSGNIPSSFAIFSATATDGSSSCTRTYNFNTMHTSGGWGDPHDTTVDDVHYDFQSAGEFTALRGGGLEIQTRQTPVATTFLPSANSYTGLATCVSIYSAVAARVGKHRVTYEPNISGVPDPTGLQLRVDGVVTTLSSGGIDLAPSSNTSSPGGAAVARPIGAKIVKSPAGDGIEIRYSNGATLVETPAWWPDQKKWYLNVNVSGTSATKGIFGKLAKNSWLPALPSGQSLGPKPSSAHQRYEILYKKFARAWRVTKSSSLFDYLPGTSTGKFNLPGWPKENPSSCAIPGETSAPPADPNVAEKQCGAITDGNMRADCVFDVHVTGHTGFAQTYQLTQQLQPGATDTDVTDNKDPSNLGDKVTFVAIVKPRLSRGEGIPQGSLQFTLDGANAGKPVTLDSKGQALWSTTSLQIGQHQIAANYIPAAGWGSAFLASTSPAQVHTVNSPIQ